MIIIDLKECILTRHSVRKFNNEKLSKEVVMDMLETSVKAPTATNSQPWAFTIIQDQDLLQEISTSGKKDVRRRRQPCHCTSPRTLWHVRPPRA